MVQVIMKDGQTHEMTNSTFKHWYERMLEAGYSQLVKEVIKLPNSEEDNYVYSIRP